MLSVALLRAGITTPPWHRMYDRVPPHDCPSTISGSPTCLEELHHLQRSAWPALSGPIVVAHVGGDPSTVQLPCPAGPCSEDWRRCRARRISSCPVPDGETGAPRRGHGCQEGEGKGREGEVEGEGRRDKISDGTGSASVLPSSLPPLPLPYSLSDSSQ